MEKIGVACSGELSPGIAHVVARGGFEIIAWNPDEASRLTVEKIFDEQLDSAVESGSLDSKQKEGILSRLQFTEDIGELREAELVIEALPEDLESKKKFFADVSSIVAENAILATSTSCYSVTEIAQAARNPERTLGIHFFKPPQSVRLVEVVRAENTSERTIDLIMEFCVEIDKEAVIVKDSPGFIVNYLFVPYMNQALNYYDHEFADRETLDTAIKMGLGYPKGPLALIDELGLDYHLKITTELYKRLKDSKFAPPPILKRMVDGGKLGKKSGQGFYSYR